MVLPPVRCAEEARQWLARADTLSLPANPLDAIMHELQQQNVPAVELSGRQEVAAQRNAAVRRRRRRAAPPPPRHASPR